MEIVFSRAYEGPSHWSQNQVIEWHVRVSSSQSNSAASQPLGNEHSKDIDDQLKAQFSDYFLACESKHSCRHISRLAFLVHALQTVSGVPSKLLPTVAAEEQIESDINNPNLSATIIALEYEEEALANECMVTAIRIYDAMITDQPVDWAVEKRRLVELADDIRLGPSSRAILRAASERGVPYYRMNCGSLVQLGEGVFQRRIWTAETDATSAIAESIAKDKQFTRTLLASAGVPAPRGRLVLDPDDAWAAAEEVGLPVVVKPRDANHARGISLDLRDRQSISTAYDWAKVDGETEEVMVEQYIEGDHHRLLVVGDRMVAAAKGQREYVTGNGSDTIEELVNEVNRDPRRGENYTDLLGVLKLDPAALIELSKQNVTPDTVLAKGKTILVRHVGDLIEDVTEQVHPSTAAIAVLAAKVVGLDIAGMDLIAKDISQPLQDQRGCIIEVNAGPSLAHHVAPLFGKPQPVGDAILELLFPTQPSDPQDRFLHLSSLGKIPITLIVSPDEQCEVAEELETYWNTQGEYVGVADYASIRCGGQIISRDCVTSQTIKSLLMHPIMTKMIVHCSMSTIAQHGIPVPRADFLVFAKSPNGGGRTISTDLESHLPKILRACRNGLTAESIVVSKELLDNNCPELQTAIVAEFGDDFSASSQRYENLFR